MYDAASGADRSIKACSPPVFPAITRDASLHTPIQCDQFRPMLSPLTKPKMIFKIYIVIAILYTGLQKSMS
jgi:hypothetical protein